MRCRNRIERLTNDECDDLEPSVSPDGRWVAFASDRGVPGGRHALFRIALDDAHIEQISEPFKGDDRQPVYSPDGKWLAFRSTRGGTSDLWVRPSAPSLLNGYASSFAAGKLERLTTKLSTVKVCNFAVLL